MRHIPQTLEVEISQARPARGTLYNPHRRARPVQQSSLHYDARGNLIPLCGHCVEIDAVDADGAIQRDAEGVPICTPCKDRSIGRINMPHSNGTKKQLTPDQLKTVTETLEAVGNWYEYGLSDMVGYLRSVRQREARYVAAWMITEATGASHETIAQAVPWSLTLNRNGYSWVEARRDDPDLMGRIREITRERDVI